MKLRRRSLWELIPQYPSQFVKHFAIARRSASIPAALHIAWLFTWCGVCADVRYQFQRKGHRL